MRSFFGASIASPLPLEPAAVVVGSSLDEPLSLDPQPTATKEIAAARTTATSAGRRSRWWFMWIPSQGTVGRRAASVDRPAVCGRDQGRSAAASPREQPALDRLDAVVEEHGGDADHDDREHDDVGAPGLLGRPRQPAEPRQPGGGLGG